MYNKLSTSLYETANTKHTFLYTFIRIPKKIIHKNYKY